MKAICRAFLGRSLLNWRVLESRHGEPGWEETLLDWCTGHVVWPLGLPPK